MTHVTAMVAEDEQPQREKLCELLREVWPTIEIVSECSDGLSALEALTDMRPQVAFLDIRMPGLSGLEVARAATRDTHVVFTTAYDQYAVSAFEQGALDYILKPIKRERLEQCVARLKDRLEDAAPANLGSLIDALQSQLAARPAPATPAPGGIRWITGTVGNITKMFGIEEVLFFQAQDKYVRVATATDEVHIRMSLRDLLGTLEPDSFWQVHRSVIVRPSAIQRIERLSDGRLQLRVKGRNEMLPVSNAFQHRFKPM
jgi:DNA-binding LytR/AlgR family response regulator